MFFNPVYKLYYIHVYLRQNALRRKYRWIILFKCDSGLVWGRGREGGRMHGRVRGIALLNARACARDSSALCSNDESSRISEGEKLLCN